MEAQGLGEQRQIQASATKLTDEQLALLPSDEHVRLYREHGYYLSKRTLAGPVPEQYRPKGDYGDRLRKHDFATFFSRELAGLSLAR